MVQPSMVQRKHGLFSRPRASQNAIQAKSGIPRDEFSQWHKFVDKEKL